MHINTCSCVCAHVYEEGGAEFSSSVYSVIFSSSVYLIF